LRVEWIEAAVPRPVRVKVGEEGEMPLEEDDRLCSKEASGVRGAGMGLRWWSRELTYRVDEGGVEMDEVKVFCRDRGGDWEGEEAEGW
jgi:hypothetical protein